MNMIIHYFSHSINQALKQRWSSLVIVLTVAISMSAIGVTFALLNNLLFQPMPYAAPEQTVLLKENRVKGEKHYVGNQSLAVQEYWKENTGTLSSPGMVFQDYLVMSRRPEQPKLVVSYSTSSYFDLFSVPLIKGKAFEQDTDKSGAGLQAIISEQVWKTWFKGDAGIIGEVLHSGGNNYTIVGVVSKTYVEPIPFRKNGKSDVWLSWNANELDVSGAYSGLIGFGQLRQGVTPSEVAKELDTLVASPLSEINGISDDSVKSIASIVLLLKDETFKNSAMIIMVLGIASVLLFLIAFVNILSLISSYILSRRKEYATKIALGAKKANIFAELFWEMSTLFVVGWFISLIVCQYILNMLNANQGSLYLNLDTLQFPISTVLVMAAVIMCMALVISSFSLKILLEKNISEQLSGSGKGTQAQVPKLMRFSFVMLQVSLASIIFLIGCGVMVKSIGLLTIDKGFNADNLYTVTVDFSVAYPDISERAPIVRQLKEEISAIDGVAGVASGNIPPLRKGRFVTGVKDAQQNPLSLMPFNSVDEEFFDTLGIKLVKGALFSKQAIKQDEKVMIVSESAAKELSPETDIIGKQYYVGSGLFTVIGVVGDVFDPHNHELDGKKKVYMPLYPWRVSFLIRTAGDSKLSKTAVVA